jgi:hypothetical protein
MPTLFDQILSAGGALLVLGAYAANLTHRLDRDGAAYAALNMVGSGVLAYVALGTSAIGLILIEAAWSLISCAALVRAMATRNGSTRHPE